MKSELVRKVKQDEEVINEIDRQIKYDLEKGSRKTDYGLDLKVEEVGNWDVAKDYCKSLSEECKYAGKELYKIIPKIPNLIKNIFLGAYFLPTKLRKSKMINEIRKENEDDELQTGFWTGVLGSFFGTGVTIYLVETIVGAQYVKENKYLALVPLITNMGSAFYEMFRNRKVNIQKEREKNRNSLEEFVEEELKNE